MPMGVAQVDSGEPVAWVAHKNVVHFVSNGSYKWCTQRVTRFPAAGYDAGWESFGTLCRVCERLRVITACPPMVMKKVGMQLWG